MDGAGIGIGKERCANLRSNIYSASDMLGASRSRQVSQEKAIAKGIHNTITQALLDRLLLLSLWFNERDLYKDLVELLLLIPKKNQNLEDKHLPSFLHI